MTEISLVEPVDYVLMGHVTVDLTPEGPRLGGTAVYSALVAQAMGLKVGIVTAWGNELPLDALQGISVVSIPAEHSTTFENIYTPTGRIQLIHHVAPRLDEHTIPTAWQKASVVHLAPVAQELAPALAHSFPGALVGATPQGWLRCWDDDGRVNASLSPGVLTMLGGVDAAVLSVEDVNEDEDYIAEMAGACHVLAVTEGLSGARLYWNQDVRRFRPPTVQVVDETGAGDVFAAAFFIRLLTTRDPWEAARFATQLSAASVTRPGLLGVPTREEVDACIVEVI